MGTAAEVTAVHDDHESDEALMLMVARGRRQHLEPLVRRYANSLLTLIRRMIGSQHRSEELFQEVFLAVWTSRRRYRYPGVFRSWLFGIATNKCREELRRRRPKPSALDDCPEPKLASGNPSPEQCAVNSETAALVATAVGRLPDAQKAVVVLRVYNGLSYREIAETVARSEATVRSNMFHALASMRKYLEPRLK